MKAATRKGVAKGKKPIAKPKATPKSVPQVRKEQKAARTKRIEPKKKAGEGKDIAESAQKVSSVLKNAGADQDQRPITPNEVTSEFVPPQPWDSLEPKQKRFCEEFIIDLNATAAYARAGYTGDDRTRQAASSRLLSNVIVRQYVAFLTAQSLERTNIRADKVLQGLAQVAFSDIRQLFDGRGALRDLRTMPDDLAMAIQGVEIFEEFDGVGKERKFIGYTKKLKLNNRVDGLVNLGKHLKLFTETVEVTGKNGGPVQHEVTNYTPLRVKMQKLKSASASK